jgi:hypothetical protein
LESSALLPRSDFTFALPMIGYLEEGATSIASDSIRCQPA